MKKYVVIICLIIFIDQLSKWYIVNLIGDKDAIEILSFLRFATIWNAGISFGILNNFEYSNIVFCSISILITCVLCYSFIVQPHYRLPLAIIIGGSTGNIIDRIRYGAVYDFIDFYINNLHWPVFNLADSFIFLGIVIIMAKSNNHMKQINCNS